MRIRYHGIGREGKNLRLATVALTPSAGWYTIENMTTAMVLCAGFGTRLRPLTDELPKPLMPIGDRPLLAHVYETLVRQGMRHVVVNTHHRAPDFGNQIRIYAPDLQVLHEPNILGTAGGVSNAASALGASDIVIWNGDIFAPDLNIRQAIEHIEMSGAGAVWVVEPLARGSGTVGLDDEGRVVRLRGEVFGSEVSGGNFLGIQVMGADLRSTVPREGDLVGDVALPHLRRGGTIATCSFGGFWDDVGTPELLLRANLRWLGGRGLDHFCASDARVDREVRLERSLVGAGAVVSGSGIVRESVIFPGAELRAPSERILASRRARLEVPRST
jgi:mannose-1-phosphate guanylyltransferase